MKKIIYILLFFLLSINSFAGENYKLSDITEGNENAKIKIYSYQSLTCPHCAVFHAKIYPLLKKDYIDTGIAKIYFKHFRIIGVKKQRLYNIKCLCYIKTYFGA